MLLATNALSMERTMGSYMLSVCDQSKYKLAELSYLQGSAELLLKFARSYDDYALELLNKRIFHTSLYSNVTELRAMILDNDFVKMCNNLTDVKRTQLIRKWGYDTADYILTIDDIRGSFVIPTILRVNTLSY